MPPYATNNAKSVTVIKLQLPPVNPQAVETIPNFTPIPWGVSLQLGQ